MIGYRVEVSPAALDDLAIILSYFYEEEMPETGHRLIRRLLAGTTVLQALPERFGRIQYPSGAQSTHFRFVPLLGHKLVYRILEAERVVVVAGVVPDKLSPRTLARRF